MVPGKEWALQTQKLFPGTEPQAVGEKETKEKKKDILHIYLTYSSVIYKMFHVLIYLNIGLNMACLLLFA